MKNASLKTKSFKPGETIIREGDVSTSIFLIKKGTVGVRKMKGSDQIEIARLYTNEVFGELSFFDRAPRSATMVAMTDVEIAEIPFASLESIYDKLPDYMKTITAALAERLRRANDMIRRLQRDVIRDGGTIPAEDDGPLSAADVLAVTEGASPVASGDATEGEASATSGDEEEGG